MNKQYKLLSFLAGLLSLGLIVALNAGENPRSLLKACGGGSVTTSNFFRDSESDEIIVHEETYLTCERVERLIQCDDGSLVVEILNKYGRAFAPEEDITPYINSNFPSLADFADSVSTRYSGTVPESVAGWDGTWTIVNNRDEDENYYYEYASYSSGFSGNAEYFTYPFTMTTTFTLDCEGVNQVVLSIRSDDNASISVLGATCSSTLHTPGSMVIEVPNGTTSFPVTVTYENIGGPYALDFSIKLRKRL
ncbi:MAG: hypothetical protein IKW49_01480 [Opitutales bacterium]|nr:hypothetical protein [Opitutales bacterium]